MNQSTPLHLIIIHVYRYNNDDDDNNNSYAAMPFPTR